MSEFEFEGVSGIVRSSNPLDELGDITKAAESARQEARATFILDEHIRKIVREEIEHMVRQLRMNVGSVL